MSDFDPRDPRTWLPVLTLEQVAAIYQRTPDAIRCALKPSAKHLFHPAPYKTHPYRWRKSDIERDVTPMRRVS